MRVGAPATVQEMGSMANRRGRWSEFDVALERLCTRRLDDEEFVRIHLDALHVKKRVGGEARYDAIVTITGLSRSGRTDVLGFDVGDSESCDFWTRLLSRLRARGLRRVDVAESGDHAGLEDAVRAVFPGARFKSSNVAAAWVPAKRDDCRRRPRNPGS